MKLFKKSNKLSAEEINKSLDKLRKQYDEYNRRFENTTYLKKAFEDRYRNALHRKMPMERFIFEELQFIKGLVQERVNEAKKKINEIKRKREYYQRNNGMSYVESVFQEMLSRIQVYPLLNTLNEEAFEDVSRFYGAIHFVGTEILPSLHFSFMSSSHFIAFSAIEKDAEMFVSQVDNKNPPILNRYQSLLERNESVSEIEKEGQNAIKEGAFWLHRLRRILKKEKETDKKIIESLDYIEKIIFNFRLKDIKPIND